MVIGIIGLKKMPEKTREYAQRLWTHVGVRLI
jgi:hypothetical protein